MTLKDVSLDDKFDLSRERIFVNGAQAVVRLLLMQRERDRRAGLNTAGFVSGYRGSPLGGLDQQFWRARRELQASNIVFQPGVNEELAATACWGSQQTELLGEGRHDGVFGLWYGKGPGVDRSGDVFRHANLAGSSRHGGVLALMGDDHTAESSTVAHATEFLFVDTMIPILNPAGVQELVDYGLYGYALSRFAGTWAALKCVKDNIESTASISVSLDRLNIVVPEIDLPPGGLNIRIELDMLGQEARLHEHKRRAAAAFVRANGLNRIIYTGGSKAKIGIITVGKSYLDVRQALDDLGIDEERARRIGLRLFKVACPWPLDLEHIKDFARGLDMIIVVEEKRSLIEVQVREDLYGVAKAPIVVGKKDERDRWLFPAKGALDPNDIAVAIGERILRHIGPMEDVEARIKRIRQFQAMLADTTEVAQRTPYFCSGCPHNTSTRVPEGSLAAAGIGCHFMALWMGRSTVGFTAMGGEGAQWVGQAPFSKRDHIFQNLGDGTYNHSGSLAIRFAIASGANITYKILFNDAVAMTGGQPHEGGLKVDEIARQVRAEGVERIAIVTDEPEKYAGLASFPEGATVHERHDLDAVQRELREVPGVSALIYDQTCAAEKRRRRKRGAYPDPDRRTFISEQVCEGCGDCGVQSNCVSIQPVETEFGRKRRIDQSSCNKDFSCMDGFCPSFVTVHGAVIRKASGRAGATDPLAGLPAAPVRRLEPGGWASIVDGIGGTGIVTIGAILGMAAHLEGKGCGMIDMAGLAQKGGAVFSHVRIAANPDDISAIRVPAGKADLILGGDLVVTGARKVLGAVRQDHTLIVTNTAQVMPGDFARSADFRLPADRLISAITEAAGAGGAYFLDATATATALFGSSMGANMLLLGYAAQRGGLPVGTDAVEQAIRLNGEAVEMNLMAFRWGRRAAHDPDAVAALGAPAAKPADHLAGGDAAVRLAAHLAAYGGDRLAREFTARVDAVARAEQAVAPGSSRLADAAAQSLFKLTAIKDEYEVARLLTGRAFEAQLAGQFERWTRVDYHLAPPFIARTGANGRPEKRRFGPWLRPLLKLLASARFLRGSVIDPFAHQAERREERRIRDAFAADLDRIAATLTAETLDAAVMFAQAPMQVRGYGPVKAAAIRTFEAERAKLLARLQPKPGEPGRIRISSGSEV